MVIKIGSGINSIKVNGSNVNIMTFFKGPDTLDPPSDGRMAIYEKSYFTQSDFDNDFEMELPAENAFFVENGKLVCSPKFIADNTNGYLNYLKFKKFPFTSDDSIAIEMVVNFGIGIKPSLDTPDNVIDSAFGIAFKGANGVFASNKFQFIKIQATNSPFTYKFIDTNALTSPGYTTTPQPFNFDDTYKLTMSTDGDVNYLNEVKNLTTTHSDSVSEVTGFNIMQPLIYTFGAPTGNYTNAKMTIHSIRITSKINTTPDNLFIGDSKTASFSSGQKSNRYAELFGALDNSSVQVYGGAVNRSIEALKGFDYLANNNVVPGRIFLNILRNDVEFAVPAVEYQANYIELVAKLKSLNPTAPFIHILHIPEFHEGYGAIDAFINAQFPNDLKFKVSNAFNVETHVGDTIHPNLLGNQLIASELKTFVDNNNIIIG